MEKAHLALANSSLVLICCAISVCVVLCQPILFYLKSRKRAKEIGISDEDVKKVTRVSGIFAIIPSLPILISYVVLMPSLGRFFPWLRLSVVGSATYETMAVDMAARQAGYESMATASFTDSDFLVVMLVTSVAILGGNLFNLTVLPFYDQKVKTLQSSGSNLVPIISAAMFLAMYAVMSTPYITNVGNPLNITTLIIAGCVSLFVGGIAAKKPKLKEFVFPISLLSGMASACILAPLFA